MDEIKLYLGAGGDIKPGYVPLDAYPSQPGTVSWTCPEKIPFEDSSVDEVFTQDFLEHIKPEDKVPLMNEIWRVLKHGGKMEHWVPNAGSRNDFGSPSHLSHWNLQQFEHFNIDSYRYDKDHVYEGFVGKFKKMLAEEVNWQDEYGVRVPQSIHVIYQAIKEEEEDAV